ncbi:hypothetical protein AeRB84_009606 [Aphanomyces euteiches]|nr:hypothetical protein AeRB84_014501 [Aphanomyces euteiches]KAH9142334.1 hypothetical protein AeRB84_013603 [Aphanomyces euteiches]KAH9146501.1 hypothetical protein AeRB84_009606 [Aphanomyces euteiches]
MSRVSSFLMRAVDSASDLKTLHRVSPMTELVVEGDDELARATPPPVLEKQPATPVSHGRLTIREGCDLPSMKMDPIQSVAKTTSGWVKSLKRGLSNGRNTPMENRSISSVSVCVVVHSNGEPRHNYSTECIFIAHEMWNECFTIDSVCSEETLILYGLDRMQHTPHYDLPLDVEEHPGLLGKVTIPLSRLPENEEIEQWYSFTGNSLAQPLNRAAIRVSLKYTTSEPIPSPSDPTMQLEESSHCPNPDQSLPTGLIDYILLVGPNGSQDNVVLRRYPSEDRVKFPLPTKIEWFCFPNGYEVVSSDTRPPTKQFTFVLSGGTDDIHGEWKAACLCILSRVPLVKFMKEVLVALAWQYLDDVSIADLSLDMWQHALRDIETAMKADQEVNVSDDLFFSHMGSLVYDMLNVDVPVAHSHTFVSAMCNKYSKGLELQETLAQLVENLNRAIVLSKDSG